jgi:acyl dehydratase
MSVQWGDVEAGQRIPDVVDEITFRRVIMNPGATGDYFPGHYDRDYAQRQGQPTIYANSLHLFGLLDRAVGEWAGPASFLVRRAVQLRTSMYAGDTVAVGGTVTGKRNDDDARLVDLALTVCSGDRVICTAEVTVRLAGEA